MKQIGYLDYVNLKEWREDNRLPGISDLPLFIPEPGTRENINVDAYQYIGWVNPDSAGAIHEIRSNAGPDSRPAYIKRQAPVTDQIGSRNDEVAASDTDRITGKTGYVRDEFRKGVPDYSETGGVVGAGLKTKMAMRAVHDTAELRCPNCGAAVDEHWDCCKTHAATAPVSRAEFEALVLRVEGPGQMPGEDEDNAIMQTLDTLGLKRSIRVLFERLELHSDRFAKAITRTEFEALVLRVDAISTSIAPPAPAVQAEPPMTFYDYAFIHAAINHRHYYGDEGVTVALIEDAHKVAGELTRNRANQP